MRPHDQRIRFHPDIVTLCIRPPRRHEQETLESFECHASGCVTCYQLMSPPSAAVSFCTEGRSKATSLRHLLYAEQGRIYAFSRGYTNHRTIVEIHPVFRFARNMLYAMDRSRPRHEYLWHRPGPKVPAKACLRPISTPSASRCPCSDCSTPSAPGGYPTHAGHRYQDDTGSSAGLRRSGQRHSQDHNIPDVANPYTRGKVNVAEPERIWLPREQNDRYSGRHQ